MERKAVFIHILVIKIILMVEIMADPMELPWMKVYAKDYDDDKYREDVRYIKSQYLPMSIEILAYVEDQCDMLEYDGSLMFDEYPDKTGIDKIVKAIYKKAAYMENMYRPVLEESDELYTAGHCTSCRGTENWLENLIRVILLNEMNYRRRRYFKRRGRR